MGDILSKGVDILGADEPMSLEAIRAICSKVKTPQCDAVVFHSIFKEQVPGDTPFEEVHRLKSRRDVLFELFDTDSDGLVNINEMYVSMS